MKKLVFLMLFFMLTPEVYAVESFEAESSANTTLLPSPFPVYVINNSVVINHPGAGGRKLMLPTDNSYKGSVGS